MAVPPNINRTGNQERTRFPQDRGDALENSPCTQLRRISVITAPTSRAMKPTVSKLIAEVQRTRILRIGGVYPGARPSWTRCVTVWAAAYGNRSKPLANV